MAVKRKNFTAAAQAAGHSVLSDKELMERRKFQDSILYNNKLIRYIGYGFNILAVYSFFVPSNGGNHNSLGPLSLSGISLSTIDYILSFLRMPCLLAMAYFCTQMGYSGDNLVKKTKSTGVWFEWPKWRLIMHFTIACTAILLIVFTVMSAGISLIMGTTMTSSRNTNRSSISDILTTNSIYGTVIACILCILALTSTKLPQQIALVSRMHSQLPPNCIIIELAKFVRVLFGNFLIILPCLSVLQGCGNVLGFNNLTDTNSKSTENSSDSSLQDPLSMSISLLSGVTILLTATHQEDGFLIPSMQGIIMLLSCIFASTAGNLLVIGSSTDYNGTLPAVGTLDTSDGNGSFQNLLTKLLCLGSCGGLVFVGGFFVFAMEHLGQNPFHDELLRKIQGAKKMITEGSVSGFADDD